MTVLPQFNLYRLVGINKLKEMQLSAIL